MKIKTINKVLSAKFQAWADSITDTSLRELVQQNTIITGGSIVSMLLGEDVNDFDLYFRNHDTCLRVARYYALKHPQDVSVQVKDGAISIRTSLGVIYKGDEEASDESAQSKPGEETFEPLYFSSNAITLSDKIQIVVRFYGEPEQIHQNYDFIHCTCYWSSWDSKLVTPERALISMMTKELVYCGSKYPLCSLIRIRKFIARKWTINAGQMLKIVLQLNDLDLNNIEVLRDQLVGVDSAYFAQVLEVLKEKGQENMSTPYMLEIIDRIFN
jgi:hypothetical protein